MRTLLATLALVLALATGVRAEDTPCCGTFAGISGTGAMDDFGTVPPAVASGCFTGNAVDDRLIVTGFRPNLVICDEMDNENNSGTTWRTSTYPGDSACASAGTGGVTCDSNRIQSFTDTGFIVGSNAACNANGQPICWWATNNAQLQTEIGLYQGDGTTSHKIETSFTPDALLTFERDANTSTDTQDIYMANIDLLPDNVHFQNNGTVYTTGIITSFDAEMDTTPPGFTVSGNPANEASQLYDFIAWNQQTRAVDQGVYVGDDTGTRTIDTTCSEGVSVVFIACDNDISGWRTETMVDPFVTDFNAHESFIARVGNVADRTGCLGPIDGPSFTVHHSLVADTTCNATGDNCTWIAVCKGAPLDSVPAFDPHTLLRAYYDFENADNGTLTNMTGTQCGSDCDMTDVNSVPRNTTNFREGAKSGDPAGVDDSWTCARATCANGTTDLNIGTTMTWGGWQYLTNDSNSRGDFYGGGTAGGNCPWCILRNATNDLINCRVTTTGDSAVTASGATNSWQINTWAFRTCVFDDTADTVQAYRNAVATGSAGSVASMSSTLTVDPRMAANQVLTSTAFFVGQLDSHFVYAGAMTTEQMCYIGSCGGDGTECTCLASDPTLYVNSGYNDRMGNCTLPACNTGGF